MQPIFHDLNLIQLLAGFFFFFLISKFEASILNHTILRLINSGTGLAAFNSLRYNSSGPINFNVNTAEGTISIHYLPLIYLLSRPKC